ncbi:unnamed protein product [Withania somnifera]
MGSICSECGADEVQKAVKNGEEVHKTTKSSSVGRVEKTMPPLDGKYYEDLGCILELEELGEQTSYENANIDCSTMFSDFSHEDEEMAMVMNLHHYVENEIIDPPSLLLPEPSSIEFEYWMDLDSPELKFGGSGPCLSGDCGNWDFKLMQWFWHPNSYEEFLRFKKK